MSEELNKDMAEATNVETVEATPAETTEAENEETKAQTTNVETTAASPEPTDDNPAPDKKPENDTLFKLGCLGVVIVFIVCVVKICEVFLGSFLDFSGLGKRAKSSQEEKKQFEQTQVAGGQSAGCRTDRDARKNYLLRSLQYLYG